MSFYDDASIVLIPSGYKTSKLYSQKPTDGSGDLSFTRTGSTATRVNESGLIERCRTNIVLHSQNFSNAAWSKSAGTTLTHSQTDPNNGTTATRIQMTSGVNNFFTQSVSGNGTRVNNLSIWIKGVTTGGTISLNTGTAASRTGTTVTYTTTWTRYSIAQNETTSATGFQIDNYSDSVGQVAGDFLIAFAQLEAGDIATDYIPTTSAAVTVGPIANLPRLDYTGGGCPKLLMEPTRTNTIIYSQSFDNSSWSKTASSVSANAINSLEGYKNADLLIPNTSSTTHNITIGGGSVSSGTVYTGSVFVKYGGYDYLNFELTNFLSANFTYRFSTNTISQTGGSLLVAGSPKAELYPDGWVRLSVSSNAINGSAIFVINFRNDSNQSSFAGDGIKGVYAYGAQLEAGSYATSYIPTFNASVTRNADSASKTSVTALLGQTEGTIFSDFSANGYDNFGMALNISNGTTSEYVQIALNSSKTISCGIYSLANGGEQAAFLKTNNDINTRYKVAIAYKENDFACYINGLQIGVDTNGKLPTSLTRIDYDFGNAGSFVKCGLNINQSLVFKTRLSNSDLATLTTL